MRLLFSYAAGALNGKGHAYMIIIKDWVAQVPEEERQLAYVGENETVVRELLLTDARV